MNQVHRLDNVRLISHSSDQDNLIEVAYKLCYSSISTQALLDSVSETTNLNKRRGFIQRLIKMGHRSPLEHVSYTFLIDRVSRVATHQLVRHRIASYSQRSQRYISEDNFTYVIPPSISSNEHALNEFVGMMNEIKDKYKKLVDTYRVAKEDARYILPNACHSSIIVTMNVRELLHFFSLRCCNKAQWEIRHMSIRMLILLRNVCGLLFDVAGPECFVNTRCNQTNGMSCGEMNVVKSMFDDSNLLMGGLLHI